MLSPVWPLVLVLDCEVHLQFLSTKKMGTSVVENSSRGFVSTGVA